ncbi:MAG: hypothetical protein H0U32_04705 [Thermoleophilaceae bacterium]|nr:hypothetical protein [Thermoleophilaceae bacterium]
MRNGDGILLRGRKLFVVQNQDEQIAVVRLRRSLREGNVHRVIRDRSFDVFEGGREACERLRR